MTFSKRTLQANKINDLAVSDEPQSGLRGLYLDYVHWLYGALPTLPPAAVAPAILVKINLASCFAEGVDNAAFKSPLAENVRALETTLSETTS